MGSAATFALRAVVETEADSHERLAASIRRLFGVAAGLNWKSYDPFDLLLSPYCRAVPAASSDAARVLVQIGKRSRTTRLRRLLRVPEHEEPKALAEFLRSALLLDQTGEAWARDYVPVLSDRLRRLALVAPGGCGWGITFPYASRFGYIAPETPTIYDTTVACQALLDEYDWHGSEAALAGAAGGCGFILEGLGTFEHNERQWFRYVPGSNGPVVNVQASAASLLARLGYEIRDERMLERADAAAATVLQCQRPDGSWPYSDDGRATFVDGFHTGFTLQGMQEYSSCRQEAAVSGVDEALERGFSFFKDHLLTSGGLPRGFADGRRSLDGQNLGQCIQTLVTCGTSADRKTALRMWHLGFENGRAFDVSGSGRRFTALRWTVAPAALAGAHLLKSARADQP